MFVPIGTPVYAPADGVIYGAGSTIGPATGRWVGIDFDNGMRFRCLHLSRLTRTSGRVKRGDLIGYSGASGYGYEDFRKAPGMPGAHTHVTLWPTHVTRFNYDSSGRPYTVDFMNYTGGPSGSGETEIIVNKEEFIGWIQEWAKYRSRDGGGADYKGGPTIFERLNGALDSLGKLLGAVNPDEPSGGKGWFPFRNAMSRWLIYHSRIDGPEGKGATIHERLNQIESAVREAPGSTVTVKLDAQMLASALSDPKVVAAFVAPIVKGVGDDIAKRMVS